MPLSNVTGNASSWHEAVKKDLSTASTSKYIDIQQHKDAASLTNTRKRAHPQNSEHARAPPVTVNGAGNEPKQQVQAQGEENDYNPSPKRSRTTEWPLKNTTQPILGVNGRSLNENRGKKTSPHSRSRKTSNRSSRFQEGSLNDKPSSQPPNAFIGAENAMEQYSQAQEAGFDEAKINFDAGIEPGRPSSMFRFGKLGKAVASAWHGLWKEKEPLAVLEKSTLDDRKAKANEAYLELKRTGFHGTKPLAIQHEAQNEPRRQSEESQPLVHSKFRDSGIDVEESHGVLFDSMRTSMTNGGLKPPSVATTKCSASPMTELSSGKRSSSLQLRSSSFSSLKKVKSQIHIPSVMRPTSTATPLPNIESSTQSADSSSTPSLWRKTSKRDLAKHQKLTKKVSDLESKLDSARRDLQQSLRDAPPVPSLPPHIGRKPFTPGGLSSLPSERLLTPQTVDIPSARTNKEIHGPTIVPSPSAQLGRELHNSLGGFDTTLSSDPLTKLDTAAEEQYSWVAPQASKAVTKTNAPRSRAPKTDITAPISAGVKKRAPKHHHPSKTPKNSPTRSDENAPPVPAISITSDAANRPRSESPFLGRPIAVSPMRTRSKAQKRGVSPPPPSPASGNEKQSVGRIYEDDTAMVDSPAAGSTRGAVRAKGQGSQSKVRETETARAVEVRVMQKPVEELLFVAAAAEEEEDNAFQWDDDVF